MQIRINKTPAKAFTPPAEKKKGHNVVFRQKSKQDISVEYEFKSVKFKGGIDRPKKE